MSLPSQLPIWQSLKEHKAECDRVSLRELFDMNPQREQTCSLTLGGLTMNYAGTHVTDKTLALLTQLAEDQKVTEWRTRMFRSDKINNTENRAVLHTALRAPTDKAIMLDGRNIMEDIAQLHTRMETFVHDVREGHWRGATGKAIQNIVNIGIGGSDLGPRFVVESLRSYADKVQVHFVANADAADILGVLGKLDAETTLFVVVSKTFTTQETLLNARTARQWVIDRLGQEAIAKHFVAVSTNHAAIKDFGIAATNAFPTWDWVGGRYSLWSAVGLTIALAIGWANFKKLLAGAHTMDQHFLNTHAHENMPVLAALIGVWYRNFWHTTAYALLPYSERMRSFPRYVQQLDMESNGKSVTREGEALDYATAPVIFGECGTVGQHSFHQLLHQGTDMIPVDFVGIRNDDLDHPEHHKILLAHLRAQRDALCFGNVETDTYRTNSGNKPTVLFWLDDLNPYNLGMLLAMYEHKVFVQGCLWNINSFDQWGVELGKKLANQKLKD